MNAPLMTVITHSTHLIKACKFPGHVFQFRLRAFISCVCLSLRLQNGALIPAAHSALPINLRSVQEERLPFSRTDQCKRLLACKQIRVGQEMGKGGMVYQEIMLREIFQVESRVFCCQKYRLALSKIFFNIYNYIQNRKEAKYSYYPKVLLNCNERCYTLNSKFLWQLTDYCESRPSRHDSETTTTDTMSFISY